MSTLYDHVEVIVSSNSQWISIESNWKTWIFATHEDLDCGRKIIVFKNPDCDYHWKDIVKDYAKFCKNCDVSSFC